MKTMVLFAATALTTGCLVGDEADDGDDVDDVVDTTVDYDTITSGLSTGVNSNSCVASPYNCRFRAGGSRVETKAGSEDWAVDTGASVRDGNGTALGKQTGGTMTFNYGQTRYLAGKAHALALATSNGSAGWYPIDHIKGETSFRDQMGEVNAKDTGGARMACYQIRNSHDANLELKKVVHDSKVGANGHERAGDYLPLERDNHVRSANLVFSVPGFALGGATTDHFPAGTKFRRIDVPTTKGPPSISIPLWVKNANDNNRYTKQSGTMRFLYGYIVSAQDNTKRFGWMAQDALEVSTNCK